MFSIDKNTYVLENIAKTIKYECFRRGFDYKEDEIKYLVLQEITNPLGEFSGAHSKLEAELNRLMDICVDFLCDHESNFSIKTCIVQSYVLQRYKCKDIVAQNYRELIKKHTNPLVVDICQSDPKTNQDYDNLYKKIVLSMLLLSGIGDATKNDYIVTAEVALKSIFPLKNLEGFIHLSFHNKLKELDDLKKTVTGIILYNEFKLDKVSISNKQSRLLDQGSKLVVDKLSTLTACLDSTASFFIHTVSEFVQFDEANENLLVIKDNIFVDNNSIHTLKSYLLLVQQCRRMIRSFLEDARDTQQEYYRLEDDYQCHVRSLLNELRGKVAISMNKVYSKFQEIGDIWTREQELCVILNAIHDAQNAVLTLSEVHRIPECLKIIAGCEGVNPVDIEELASNITYKIDSNYFYEARIDPLRMQGEVIFETDDSLDKIEYNGFCPVYCVESGGFLLDARKEIGVLQYDGKLYGFRDIQAAYIFGKDPKSYINKVIEFVRFNVDYIEVLSLTAESHKSRGVKVCREEIIAKSIKPVRDKEVQTEIHPIESHIDKNYSWNLWDHKRRAVHLADIIKCTTKSTQSYWSHFRETAFVQTYSPREGRTQTMCDSGICTDNIPPETWCIRGKEPHIRVTTSRCLPGPKHHPENEYCDR